MQHYTPFFSHCTGRLITPLADAAGIVMSTLVCELTGSGDEAGCILDAGFHVINNAPNGIEIVMERIDYSP